MQNDVYCNNCGKNGHLFHQCKLPITSIGIIAFRFHENQPEFLMIRRKDSLGYIDFMRGKYSLNSKEYMLNMLNQMTLEEKDRLKTHEFKDLWYGVWGGSPLSLQYKNEETISMDKFKALQFGQSFQENRIYTLNDLIDESNTNQTWTETEWGFPKGRRNNRETDYDCALREFTEETGYSPKLLQNIQNIIPFEEIFTGSNYKSYKHKYFVMHMSYEDSLKVCKYDASEVSKMEWKPFHACLDSIRPYNIEKKLILDKINTTIVKHSIM